MPIRRSLWLWFWILGLFFVEKVNNNESFCELPNWPDNDGLGIKIESFTDPVVKSWGKTAICFLIF